MAYWHGYIIIARQTLAEENWLAIKNQYYNITVVSSRHAHHLLQTRESLDGDELIIEGLFDENTLTIEQFKTFLSNASADGLACVSSSYFRAHLYFDRDLKQDRYGFEVLCHEILHLVTQPMADAAKDIAGFLLDDDDAERLMDMWTRAEEQTISRIARGLAREFAWEDFIPEHLREKEQKPDGEE